jgi:hypothetical protein
MANYYISTTGTRTTGASTADDWSNANCYNQTNFYAIVEAAGDTFVFDAGEYIPTADWNCTQAVTISTRGNGNVALTRPAGATTNLNTAASVGGTISILGSEGSWFILDGTNCSNAWNPQNVSCNTVCEYVEIRNGGSAYGILMSQRTGSFVANHLKFSGVFPGDAFITSISLADVATMLIDITDVEYNVTTSRAATSTAMQIVKGDFANNLTVKITNVSGSYINSSGPVIGVIISGANTVDVHNTVKSDASTFIISSPSLVGGYGVWIRGVDAVNRRTVNPVAYNLGILFEQRAGTALNFGAVGEAGSGYTVNPTAYNNNLLGSVDVTQSPHGLVFGGLTSGKGYKNTIRRFHSPMMLSECTNNAVIFYGNLLFDCYGVPLSFKGNSGGTMANNTAVLTPNSIDGITHKATAGIWAREQVGANTGGQAINNNILILGVSIPFVIVDTGDALTLSGNNYYTDQVLAANAWQYTGVNYATLTAWNAAQETVNATDAAIFTATIAEIVAAFGNLSPENYMATPLNYGGGVKWFSTGSPETLGDPLPATNIDKGAVQSYHAPFHPRNL